jgi:hypothetical protein
MADSPVFERVCEVIEQSTDLDRLESRGTVRLSLKQAGLEARNVTASQMSVILEKVLPTELATHGVTDIEDLLDRAGSALSGLDLETDHSSPEAVFERLGR